MKIFRLIIDTENKKSVREMMVFCALAVMVFVITSTPNLVIGFQRSDLNKFSAGMFGILIACIFATFFLWLDCKLNEPFISKTAFIAWLDYWSMPVFAASVLVIIGILGYSSYTGQLWNGGLINPYTLTLLALFGLGAASFISKALIWNHPEVKE